MTPKSFLVTVGTALAALITSTADTSQIPEEFPNKPVEQGVFTEGVKRSSDSVIERIFYQIKNQEHLLFMRKSASGAIYADHSSHASHGSHGSHGSHSSHSSGQ